MKIIFIMFIVLGLCKSSDTYLKSCSIVEIKSLDNVSPDSSVENLIHLRNHCFEWDRFHRYEFSHYFVWWKILKIVSETARTYSGYLKYLNGKYLPEENSVNLRHDMSRHF